MRSIEPRERDAIRNLPPHRAANSSRQRRVVVQKYGGSSVATVEKIRAVAQNVAASRAEGVDVVVVVSAMGKTTDSLLDLARGVSDAPPPREMDMLLSSGERISCSLLAMAIQALGVPAVSLTGPQCGIRTDDAHATARILDVQPARLERELAAGRVVVVAGFQGESPRREVTTLGRGGSDATAVALAAALAAERCDIFSDVDGVYTSDPRVCPDARHIPRLGYDEMLELARQGAKVLNTHAVDLARRDAVPIHARSTFGSSAFTVVASERAAPSDKSAVGVTGRRDLWRVTCDAAAVDAVERATEGIEALATRLDPVGALERILVTQDVSEASTLRRVLTEAGARVEDALGSVAIVGRGVGESPELCLRALRVLDAARVDVVASFTTRASMTCVVRAEHVDDGTRALHRALFSREDLGDRRVA